MSVNNQKTAEQVIQQLEALGAVLDRDATPPYIFCPDNSKIPDIESELQNSPYSRVKIYGKSTEHNVNNDIIPERIKFARSILERISDAGYRFDMAVSPIVVKYPKFGSPGAAKAFLKDYPYPYAEPIPVDYKLSASEIGGSLASTTPKDAPAALLPDPK